MRAPIGGSPRCAPGGAGDVTRLSDNHHLANGFANFTAALPPLLFGHTSSKAVIFPKMHVKWQIPAIRGFPSTNVLVTRITGKVVEFKLCRICKRGDYPRAKLKNPNPLTDPCLMKQCVKHATGTQAADHSPGCEGFASHSVQDGTSTECALQQHQEGSDS